MKYQASITGALAALALTMAPGFTAQAAPVGGITIPTNVPVATPAANIPVPATTITVAAAPAAPTTPAGGTTITVASATPTIPVGVGVPDIEIEGDDVAEVEAPEVEDFEVAEIETPDVEAPEIETPEVETPELGE